MAVGFLGNHLLLLGLVLALSVPLAHAGKLYRWVDNQGNVHYADKIPPEEVRKEHTEFSPRGTRKGEVPRAKTREELEAEKAQDPQKVTAEEAAARQKELDDQLLATFENEDEVVMIRDGKIAALDIQIGVTHRQVRHLQEEFAGLIGAEKPREGAEPAAVAARRKRLRDNIVERYGHALSLHRRKQDIRREYEAKQNRYRELKRLGPATGKDLNWRTIEDETPTLVKCREAECNSRWTRARTYLKKNADLPVIHRDSRLVMTAMAAETTTIGLSLARTPDPRGGEWIFLHLQCKDTALGAATCRNDRAREIRDGFRPALSGENDDEAAERKGSARPVPIQLPAVTGETR
ncbi:MAG: DUF4124 domain-containing protein [Pseudomonadota bacterium]